MIRHILHRRQPAHFPLANYGTMPTLPLHNDLGSVQTVRNIVPRTFSFEDLMATIGFNGLTVAAFESRMAVEIARLIERQGGKPLVTPALREIPLDDNSAALKFGVKLTTERVDLLILLTGVGTTALFDLLKTRYPWSSIVAALKQTALVARGPKPVAALKALGLQPTLTVPEPNTWVDLISTLDEYRPVKGLRVAVQEYGVSNPDLLKL